jgi:streptogramin lyase
LALIALSLLWPAGASAAPVTVFSNGVTQGSGPSEMTSGPDGNLWYTAADRIGRVNPTTGHVDEFTAGITPGSLPLNNSSGITTGPDGNLYFTEPAAHRIARISPSGTISELPAVASGFPQGIARGSDGNLWFTESGSGPTQMRVARITTSGQITEFPPAGLGTAALGFITPGSDGNLWFTEPMNNKVGRITTAGTISEFSSGLAPNFEGPEGMALGGDGNIWFTEGDNGRSVGRITTGGTITEFPNGLPADTAPGDGMTTGADGNLWFTVCAPCESATGVDGIARFTLTNDFTLASLKARRSGLITAVLKNLNAGTFVATASTKTKRLRSGSAAASKRARTIRYGSASASTNGPGTVTLMIKPSKKTKGTLKKSGKLRVTVAVTFSPRGGTANTKTETLKVKG